MAIKTKIMLAASVAVLSLTVAATAYAQTTITKETVVQQSPAIVTDDNGDVVKKTTIIEQRPVETSNTIVKETVTQEKPIMPASGTRVINFADFDLNHDGILSTNEVGEMLFKLFDTDGNGVIDNIEFKKKSVLTIAPMEKETITTYDFDNDGKPDQTKYTYETFMKDTQLTRFDHNRDGLSPADFTGKYFEQVDVNKDHAIDLKEWKGTYIASINKKNHFDAETNK